jgi:hypothetical protein
MAVDPAQLAMQDVEALRQGAAQRAQQAAQEEAAKQEPSFLQKWVTGPVGRVTTSMLDGAISAADSYSNSDAGHKARDVVSGVMTGATNIADSVGSLLTASGKGMAAAEDPEHADAAQGGSLPTSPIWDHAKSTILDFRDAVAVQDPTLADNLVQGAAQLAVPFAGYSRALAGVAGFANIVAAGALTDATALGPHDPRMADLIALGRHTEGKLGDALRALTPDGSAQNAYLNYLADRGNESEAEGRFKNVLDGFGANLIMTPLLTAAGSVIKQGTAGLRYLAENGVGSAGAMAPARQEGHIVFHGTAADFDQFDMSKMGTGEGNQAFGHGMYFAENPATAGHYQQMLAQRSGVHPDLISAADDVAKAGGDKRKAYMALTTAANNSDNPAERMFLNRKAQLIKSGAAEKAQGKLMHVDIPDEHIEKMIDWDKPISEQPSLQQAFKDLNVTIGPGPNRDFQVMVNGQAGPRYLTKAAAESETALLRGESHEQDAGMGYRQLSEAMRSPKAASEYLGSKGIPGIKFLDQVSRATGKGTRNIVLFDAEKHAKIIKKE